MRRRRVEHHLQGEWSEIRPDAALKLPPSSPRIVMLMKGETSRIVQLPTSVQLARNLVFRIA
jgi:hypothetical protein